MKSTRIENGNGIVASDFHDGQWGTTSRRAINTLKLKIDQLKPTLLVLNGDIVEGKDLHGTPEQIDRKIDKAIQHVRELAMHAIGVNPQCQIVYVFGNHDTYIEIRDKLKQLQREEPICGHFHLRDVHFRCRDTLFTHGDFQVHRGSDMEVAKSHFTGVGGITTGTAKNRLSADPDSRWRTLDPCHGVHRFIHQSLIDFGSIFDQEVQPYVMPTMAHVRGIVDYYRTQDASVLEGVKNIMIGHLHTAYKKCAHEHDGFKVHITGPATAKSKNSMLSFKIHDQAIDQVTQFSDRWSDRNEIQTQIAAQRIGLSR